MGAYTCQFGIVHKTCRCPTPHSIVCDTPDVHAPKAEHVEPFEGEVGISTAYVGEDGPEMTTFVGGEEIITELEEPDKINPSHYKSSNSGVECIEITEHLSFTLGNAIKYMWRLGLKDDTLTELKKARWYLEREYALRPTLAWISFPTAPDYEVWATKFARHIDTVEDDDLQQALSFCLSSVSPKQKRKDLFYALEYLENVIRREEKKKK